MARLGDVCKLVSGTSLPETIVTDNGELPYVKVAELNMQENIPNITTSRQFVSVTNISAKQIIPVGTVIFPKRGGAIGTNKKRLVSTPICMDLNLMGVIPSSKLYPQYLYYFFENIDMGSLSNGSSVPQINNSDIAPLEIRIPDISTQKDIATHLDKVGKLIALRKAQLAKLDQLVKSRFIELFGDQETNPYNLNVGKLSDVADICLGLTHTPTYVERGRPFLSVRDISSGVIDFSNCHYVTEEEFGSLPNGARPKVGDMLFCRVGTIGKPVIIPENTPEFGTFVSVGYLRKKANVNNYYLKSWMENDYFMRQVYDNVAGASQINLNTGWLKNFRILIPSMELQELFAAFVKQTDKSKLAIQQSLDKLELLKKSLMQEYFG